MERLTPAKRARDEGASLAPAPELAAASDAISVASQVKRRVRRQLIGSAAPDQGAGACASSAQSSSVLGAAAHSSAAAADSETSSLKTDPKQPAGLKTGQRHRRAAGQIRQPSRQPVTRSVTASRHPATGLPAVQDKSVATGECSGSARTIQHNDCFMPHVCECLNAAILYERVPMKLKCMLLV